MDQNGSKLNKMDQSGPKWMKWTEFDPIGLNKPKRAEVDPVGQNNGPNELKWINKYENGLKCTK